ncbi:hypothetical protein [Mycobacterium sp. NPDC050041]|uniref:hypothetical protein n=1 Tax=Mycobacterium sp. NPDC050041 TaxID=3364293 RepID=UPI003C2E5D48
MTVPAPSTVRMAAVLVLLQGAAGLAAAVFYVVSGLSGEREPGLNFYGTAGWFAIIGGAVAAAGWALWTGRRWGRGVAVFAQLLLLGVSWYVGVGSHQWAYGIPLALTALVVLVLLFSPATLQWLAAPDDQDAGGAASADNSGPDTR